MTPNRRIFLNIIATYGRSLYALVCGLFISRWVLAAGKSELGLCDVFGGMMLVVGMVDAMSLTRISSEAIGRAGRFTGRVALRFADEQREWHCEGRPRSQEDDQPIC